MKSIRRVNLNCVFQPNRSDSMQNLASAVPRRFMKFPIFDQCQHKPSKTANFKQPFSIIGKKVDFSDDDRAAAIVNNRIKAFDFPGSLQTTTATESSLKDGSSVSIRQPGPGDVERLCAFVNNARFGMFDYLRTAETTADAVCDYLANVTVTYSGTSDTLIAVVNDKIVGVTTYEPCPGEMEEPINYYALEQCGGEGRKVCVAKTTVLPGMWDKGVASALKKEQMKNAEKSGYEGIVSQTSHDAIKMIAKNSGGKFSNGWTFIPLKKGGVESSDNITRYL
ncbi:hypothetical protein AWB78_08290 [Caballeronia calidae]|uniref:N-acetyltransferase domain-containing protein n=1 Tax=Caballeronia calidae TaxID=1777139 RepID=A0A158EKD9_9BURK|nr:hypothetical protein [Caballeronia calidae]SAL06866.1 hypothetical protein AWB78_08290 [Caballeronia calidae]